MRLQCGRRSWSEVARACCCALGGTVNNAIRFLCCTARRTPPREARLPRAQCCRARGATPQGAPYPGPSVPDRSEWLTRRGHMHMHMHMHMLQPRGSRNHHLYALGRDATACDDSIVREQYNLDIDVQGDSRVNRRCSASHTDARRD